jgi:hydroxypyruvate reductase
MMTPYEDAQAIIKAALESAQPDAAVRKALKEFNFGGGKVVLVAIGKAAWQMALAASTELGGRISSGVVITKYGHAKEAIPNMAIFEAGHPVPDENAIVATEAAIEAVKGLSENDNVLFLVSGGGSSLFEKPLVPLAELEDTTRRMLASGADIVEMNIIRKRLSAVKGGRFAKLCEPAKVYSVILSDIINDPLDMIASGPAFPDSSTSAQAIEAAKRRGIGLSPQAELLLMQEMPKSLTNTITKVTGSVRQLCLAAEAKCLELGYKPLILSASLTCNAKDAGAFLASIAQYHNGSEESLAFIAGGETVVEVKGTGKGGRNQEIALSAAIGLHGLTQAAVFSVGSDGTDGPTDAAGGYADELSFDRLLAKGIDPGAYLANNDAYAALDAIGALIKTGPTGTNVNDLTVLLIKRN